MKKICSKLIISFALILMATLSFADPIWIDVRTAEEHLADNISGDMNIPMANISPESIAEIFGRDAEINLYCRSGGRAGTVTTMLTEAGFTNVNNMGGIEDVRKMREEAEKNSSH